MKDGSLLLLRDIVAHVHRYSPTASGHRVEVMFVISGLPQCGPSVPPPVLQQLGRDKDRWECIQ